MGAEERAFSAPSAISVLVRRAVALSSRAPWTPLVVAAGALWIAAFTSGLGPRSFGLAALLVGTSLIGVRHRRLVEVALPFIVFAATYEWLGWLSRSIRPDDVHVFFPYWFDKTVFGVGPLGDQLSCNEVFARHHLLVVDFVSGLAYLSFLPCVLGFAAYLLVCERRAVSLGRARRFGWTFLGVNVAGFVTYYLCPVAPPWYVAARGFGPVDLGTAASPAALVRWDALMGIPYFDRFYAQATEVFGALPSLHCAYPMLLFLFACEGRRRSLIVVLGAYVLLMAFSAVYLQHHYVTDAIAGVLYASAGYGLGRWVEWAASSWWRNGPPARQPHAPLDPLRRGGGAGARG